VGGVNSIAIDSLGMSLEPPDGNALINVFD
jgi:hypothetical protein